MRLQITRSDMAHYITEEERKEVAESRMARGVATGLAAHVDGELVACEFE